MMRFDVLMLAWFRRSATVLLAIVGSAKIVSALAPTKILVVADPVTGISFGHLMLMAGILECVIAGIGVFGKSSRLAIWLIAWLATILVVYRAGLWWVGWNKPCPCLGNLTDALNISPQTGDTAMKILLAYLLIGSYATLFWLWKREQKDTSAVSSDAPVSAT